MTLGVLYSNVGHELFKSKAPVLTKNTTCKQDSACPKGERQVIMFCLCVFLSVVLAKYLMNGIGE